MDSQVYKLPGESKEGSEPTVSTVLTGPYLHFGTEPEKGISPTQPGLKPGSGGPAGSGVKLFLEVPPPT